MLGHVGDQFGVRFVSGQVEFEKCSVTAPHTADVGFAAVPAEKTVPIQIPELLQTSSQALDRSKEKTVTVKEAAYRLGKSEDAVYPSACSEPP